MRAPSIIAAVAAVLLLTACGGRTADEFDQTDRENINKLVQDFIASYNAKDATKVSGLFSDNGAVMPPNASTARGTINVEAYYKKRFDQGASDLKLEVGDVIGVGSLAYAAGDYWLNMAPPGGTVRRDRGKFLFVLREWRGRWTLERLMFSSDFAPEGNTTS